MQWQHAGPATAHHVDPSLSSTSAGGWGAVAASGPPLSAAQPPSQTHAAAAGACAEFVGSGVGAAGRQFAGGTPSTTFSQRLPHHGGLPPPQATFNNTTFTDGPSAKYGMYGRPPGAVYPQHK